MKIGLLLPSALMYEHLSGGKIFAPRDLFLDLARGLAVRGHRVRVYAPTETELQADVVQGSMSLIISEPYAMKLRYVGDSTRDIIKRQQARFEYEIDLTARAYKDAGEGRLDIIHSFLEFSAHYFAEVTRIPTVYTVHDTLPDKKYLDFWRYERFPQDNYVAISRSQAEELEPLVKVTDVVYNGIDPADYTLQPDRADYLLYAGRYMPEKGVEDAIRTANDTKTLLVMAGSKEYKEIVYYINTIKPYLGSPYVKEVGFMDNKHKNGLYGGAKALLFPIRWAEPFGMVMIEAMACGTPVIAYNNGSVAEVIKDGVTGFIIEEDKGDTGNQGNWAIKKKGVEGLAEAVGRIGEIDRRTCRKHVEENFTVERMVQGYEEVYKKVIDSKK